MFRGQAHSIAGHGEYPLMIYVSGAEPLKRLDRAARRRDAAAIATLGEGQIEDAKPEIDILPA
jgi:hypothetical protein